MGGALALLALLPLTHRLVSRGGFVFENHPLTAKSGWWRETEFSLRRKVRLHQTTVTLLGAVFLLLGFVGGQPVAEPYLLAGQLLSASYFLLLLLLPLLPLKPATNLGRRLDACLQDHWRTLLKLTLLLLLLGSPELFPESKAEAAGFVSLENTFESNLLAGTPLAARIGRRLAAFGRLLSARFGRWLGACVQRH